jgi:fibrillarin-like rRNA methylase
MLIGMVDVIFADVAQPIKRVLAQCFVLSLQDGHAVIYQGVLY